VFFICFLSLRIGGGVEYNIEIYMFKLYVPIMQIHIFIHACVARIRVCMSLLEMCKILSFSLAKKKKKEKRFHVFEK
jgi:hypothetical protein